MATKRPSARGSAKKEKEKELIDWEAVARLDEECRELRDFNLKEKLKDEALGEAREGMVVAMTGKELTVEALQAAGFTRPILVTKRDDLGLKLPHKDFTIDGIRSAVGSRRQLEVLDTRTQKTKTMCMREWCRYWEQEPREEILNGISLEFSKTRLDLQVTAPRIVRQMDWIDKAWPRHLKELQAEASNNLKDMLYPKVQKFVIMSTANSFIDFHVDFGGTSVWYHVLRGHKVFWLVPPTDSNLGLYEDWARQPPGKAQFFGARAEGCCRLELPAGSTLFLPAGWVHAVFTPKDSVAFSGSFLHSLNIAAQLKVNYIERAIGVAEKHRFPFFTEMLWYVLDRYVACLTGLSHLDLPEEEKRRMKLEKGENIDPNKEFVNPGLSEEIPAVPQEHVHLTAEELRGLKFIVIYLQQLPDQEKEVPVLIPDPAALVRSVRDLVLAHKQDCPKAAVTGKYVLRWTEDDDVDEDSKSRKVIPRPSDYSATNVENPQHQKFLRQGGAKAGEGARRGQEAPRKRRARCQTCAGCVGSDCQECAPCRDMPKHGGPGRVKQSCIKRRCARPTLPLAAACTVCGLDGWGESPDPRRTVEEGRASSLYECLLCWDVRHRACGEGEGVVLSRLANSWECPACSRGGGGDMDTS